MAEAIITRFEEECKENRSFHRKADSNNKTVVKRCYGQNNLRRRQIVLGIHGGGQEIQYGRNRFRTEPHREECPPE